MSPHFSTRFIIIFFLHPRISRLILPRLARLHVIRPIHPSFVFVQLNKVVLTLVDRIVISWIRCLILPRLSKVHFRHITSVRLFTLLLYLFSVVLENTHFLRNKYEFSFRPLPDFVLPSTAKLRPMAQHN